MLRASSVHVRVAVPAPLQETVETWTCAELVNDPKMPLIEPTISGRKYPAVPASVLETLAHPIASLKGWDSVDAVIPERELQPVLPYCNNCLRDLLL